MKYIHIYIYILEFFFLGDGVHTLSSPGDKVYEIKIGQS